MAHIRGEPRMCALRGNDSPGHRGLDCFALLRSEQVTSFAKSEHDPKEVHHFPFWKAVDFFYTTELLPDG